MYILLFASIFLLSSCSKKVHYNLGKRIYLDNYIEYASNAHRKSVYCKLPQKKGKYISGSVIYTDNKYIVTGTYTLSSRLLKIYIYDINTMQEIKNYKYPVHINKSYSACVYNGIIFIHNNDDQLLVINNIHTNKYILHTVPKIRGQILLDNQRIYFYNNGLHAYDLVKQEIIWYRQLPDHNTFKDKIKLHIKDGRIFCWLYHKISIDQNGKIDHIDINFKNNNYVDSNNELGMFNTSLANIRDKSITGIVSFVDSLYTPILFHNMIHCVTPQQFLVFDTLSKKLVASFDINASISANITKPFLTDSGHICFTSGKYIYIYDGIDLNYCIHPDIIDKLIITKNGILTSNKQFYTSFHESPINGLA